MKDKPIPQKVLDHFDITEKDVVWTQYVSSKKAFLELIVIILFVCAYVYLVFIRTDLPTHWMHFEFNLHVLIPLMFLFMIIKDMLSSMSHRYIVTHDAFYFAGNDGSRFTNTYTHQDIWKIEKTTNFWNLNQKNISFKSRTLLDGEGNLRELNEFKGVSITDDDYELIINTWLAGSKHQQIINKFQQYVEKHEGLKLVPFHPLANKDIIVMGKVGNTEIDFRFSSMYQFHTLRFNARCRNPHLFNFKIYPEKGKSSIKKKLGMQDIVVGNDAFDKLYIVQSNNESYIKTLLDERTINSIHNHGKLKGHISFGEDLPKKPVPKPQKESEELLDDQLILQIEDKNEHHHHISILSYKNEEFKHYGNFTMGIIDHAIRNLDSMIHLTKRIEEVEKENVIF